MVNIENTSDVVNLITEKDREDIVHIVLNKEIRIDALQMEKINLGINIEYDKSYDMCFFIGDVSPSEEVDKVIIRSLMISNSAKHELAIDVQNVNDEAITLPINTELGYLINVYSANNILDIDASSGINVYKDDKIIIKSLDDKIHNIETIIDENGNQKLQVEL